MSRQDDYRNLTHQNVVDGIEEIAKDLEEMAGDIRRRILYPMNDASLRHNPLDPDVRMQTYHPYADKVQDAQHIVLWGVANLGLTALVGRAGDADRAFLHGREDVVQ